MVCDDQELHFFVRKHPVNSHGAITGCLLLFQRIKQLILLSLLF
ncbi:hypothetical protein HMPREF1592_00011 [Escherichia coli 907357]|nr:hypothetical protein HMPREF1592_00011 [Escherichia coli 907357]